MFKIGLSLSVAVIAAFAIALAGILNEVRVGTMLLRAFLGFLAAGALVYLALYLLEMKGSPGKESVEEPGKGEEDDEATSALPPEGGEEDEEESSGFQPMTEDSLERVEPQD